MDNKFICLDFCNGELMEKKVYMLFSDVLRFLDKAESPIVLYGIILRDEEDI